MNKYITLAALLLCGCSATIPEPYQRDLAPRDRTEYNGVAGLLQSQKDRQYLMAKELGDKCTNAKVAQALAGDESNTRAMQMHQEAIADYCL